MVAFQRAQGHRGLRHRPLFDSRRPHHELTAGRDNHRPFDDVAEFTPKDEPAQSSSPQEPPREGEQNVRGASGGGSRVLDPSFR